MYAQALPGIQLSGCYITSSGNSDMRNLAAELAHDSLRVEGSPALPLQMAIMGDDAVEPLNLDLEDAYARLGFKIKGISIWEDGVYSFCSSYFDKTWKGQPESWRKTLFRFLSHPVSDPHFNEWRRQLEYDLRHSPSLSTILSRVDLDLVRRRSKN